jgi:hypothetical protein
MVFTIKILKGGDSRKSSKQFYILKDDPEEIQRDELFIQTKVLPPPGSGTVEKDPQNYEDILRREF